MILIANHVIYLSFIFWGVLHSHGVSAIEKGTDKRFISVNLCTDQLLLLFSTDLKNIDIKVSPLAYDAAYNYLSEQVNPLQVIKPQMGSLLLAQPTTVFAGPYTDKYLVQGLDRLGMGVEVIPVAKTFEQIFQNISTVSSIINDKSQGQRIVNDLRERLKASKDVVQYNSRYSAIIYAPNGFTHGTDTIYNEILKAAGLRNLAAERGIVGDGYLSIEDLILNPPDYLIFEDNNPSSGHSLAQSLLSHPALKVLRKTSKVLTLNANLFSCAGPSSFIALEKIIEQL